MEETVTYFAEPGKINTEETLKLAKERATSLGIKKVVLATTKGFTARRALEVFEDVDIKLIVVTYKRSYQRHIAKDLIDMIEKGGHNWVFCDELDYCYPQTAQDTLRRFSEGMKACVEDVMVATEAGLILKGEEVVTIAGTGYRGYKEKGGGADTAIVMQALDSESFFNIESKKEERRKIKQIICKPI